MSKTVGYAVVGLGVGKNHVKGVLASKGGKLVAICDCNPEVLNAVRDSLKEQAPDVLAYESFEEMLKNPDIDAISICTPSGRHSAMAIQALRAGKHLLIEKPMDITVDKILAVEQVRKETGLKVGGIFQNRFNAVMEPVKKAIDEGRLGKLFSGLFRVNWYRTDAYFLQSGGWRGTWEMDGGGSLMNQGVHTVDIMQWLLGDVKSVRSMSAILNHKIETEDYTNSIITFKNGVVANLISTTCAYPGFGTDIQINGTDGGIFLDGARLVQWKIKGESKEAEEAEAAEMLAKYGEGNKAGGADDPTNIRAFGHSYQVQDMIDAVRFDRDPAVGPMEAVKAVRIINAVYESARTGKEIFFD